MSPESPASHNRHISISRRHAVLPVTAWRSVQRHGRGVDCGMERGRGMRRHFIAFTVCVALAAPLLPAAALAGGRPHAPRARHAVGPTPARVGYRPRPNTSRGARSGRPADSRCPSRGAPRPWLGAARTLRAPQAAPRLPRVPGHDVLLRSGGALRAARRPGAADRQRGAGHLRVTDRLRVSNRRGPAARTRRGGPAAALPSVVEHPTGRYELRGDGGATPYTWVWIPNAPPAPPVATAPAPEEPRTRSVPPAARSRIYRWTDDDGTTVWTNRVESIPAPQRPGAKKLGQVAAQP